MSIEVKEEPRPVVLSRTVDGVKSTHTREDDVAEFLWFDSKGCGPQPMFSTKAQLFGVSGMRVNFKTDPSIRVVITNKCIGEMGMEPQGARALAAALIRAADIVEGKAS